MNWKKWQEKPQGNALKKSIKSMDVKELKDQINLQLKEKEEKLEYDWREAIASCSKEITIIKDSEETH